MVLKTGLSKKRLLGKKKGSFSTCKLAGLSKKDCDKGRKAKKKFVKAVNKRTKKIKKVKNKSLKNKRLA